MAKKELTGHWRKQFDNNYIGSWSIVEGKEPTLTIAKLGRADVESDRGKENKFIIHFKEAIDGFNLPMIINSTNARILEDLYGASIEGWIGKQVELYIDHNIKAFGSTVDGLRFRKPPPPKVKQKLTPKHPKWNSAKESVQNGTTIDQIRKHYEITQENFDLLCKQ